MSANKTARILMPVITVVAVIALTILIVFLVYARRQPSKKPCLAHRRSDRAPASQADDPIVLPGGRPEDATLAQTNPDEYAWKLFLAINRQALAGKRGVPDPSKPTVGAYEDDKSVIWETWALSSGGREGNAPLPEINHSEVFRNQGETPRPWDQLGTSDKSFEELPAKRLEGLFEFAESARIAAAKKTPSFSPQALRNSIEQTTMDPRFIDPSLAEQVAGSGEEVRMNRATFEHIVAHNLYNIEGLEEAFRKYVNSPDPNNPERINVPPAAQEIKAKWVRIREEDKPRFHWRTLPVAGGGPPQIWGLTALHITTKDLDHWFWCDFEHVDYLALPVHSVDRTLDNESDRGELASRDSTTRGPAAQHAAVDCQNNIIGGMREETAGTKWENYRLRGTQVNFTCINESTCETNPTILANTQIEKGFQQSSSCITCHARASIGLRASETKFLPKTLRAFLSVQMVAPQGFVLTGLIGEQKEEWFFDKDTHQRAFIQTDFMWSPSFRAMSTKAPVPAAASTPAPTTCPSPCPLPSPAKPSP
jgi:hypothetical protein